MREPGAGAQSPRSGNFAAADVSCTMTIHPTTVPAPSSMLATGSCAVMPYCTPCVGREAAHEERGVGCLDGKGARRSHRG